MTDSRNSVVNQNSLTQDSLTPGGSVQGASDVANETNAEYQQRTAITVGELRKKHGPQFAPGYQDSDKIGQVLASAGVNTVEELLEQTKKG